MILKIIFIFHFQKELGFFCQQSAFPSNQIYFANKYHLKLVIKKKRVIKKRR